MTIKTLNYIHQLLIQEEASRRDFRKAARKAADDANSHNGPLAKAADRAYDRWSEAHEALIDFERREW